MSKGVSLTRVAIEVRNRPLTYLLNENLKSYDIGIYKSFNVKNVC